jgi:hypothetical protein
MIKGGIQIKNSQREEFHRLNSSRKSVARRSALAPEHLQDDKNQNRSAESSAEKQIQK